MAVTKQLIDNVNKIKTTLNEISVYNLDVKTSLELYYELAKKVNEVINELSRFEGVVSEEVVEQNKKLIYLLGEGLKLQVALKIDELIANGTIQDLINNKIFNELNNKIEAYKRQADEQFNTKANKDEVVKKGQVDLDEMTERTLQAIKGGEGSSFELLSIPRDKSVSIAKTNFATSMTQYICLENVTYNKYYTRGSVEPSDSTTSAIISPIEIKKGVTYYYKDVYGYFCTIKYNNGSNVHLSETTSETTSGNFTAIDNGYIYLTVNTTTNLLGNSAMLTNSSEFPVEYCEGDYNITIKNLTNIDGERSIIDDSITADKINFAIEVNQYLKLGEFEKGYYYNNNLVKSTNNGCAIYKPIQVKKGVTYYYKNLYAYFCTIKYNDDTKQQLSTSTDEFITSEFTPTKDGLLYISIKLTNSQIVSKPMLINDINLIDMDYQEGTIGVHFNNLITSNDDRTIKYNNIHVGKSGYDFSKITDAINSITSSNYYNRYNIIVHSGIYDLVDEFGGSEWVSSISHSNGERQGLVLPDYVNLEGVGSVEINCIVEDGIATVDFVKSVSCINIYMNNNLKNIVFKAKNTRYVLHDETNNSFNYLNRNVEDCEFIHLGNKAGTWGMCKAVGGGTGSGGRYNYKNCIFKSVVCPFTYHLNGNQEANNFSLDGCVFEGQIDNYSIGFGYYKNNTDICKVFIKNCVSDNKIRVYNETGSLENNNVFKVYNFTNIPVTVE